MEKRARTALVRCQKHKHKASKENIRSPACDTLLEDQISRLPCEIIVDILSQLKTNEAGRTSILSRRWRYMWTTVVNLEFDASEVLSDMLKRIRTVEVERPIYLSCVNQAIRNHKGNSIDRFVVVFSLDESSGCDINKWVNFAVGKGVQSLKLDLSNQWGATQRNCYNLPEISRCSSLTSLHLAEINITGEALQLLLCSSLNLERVYIKGSMTLVSLNVDGASLKLKWLDLHMCHNIEYLNVSAPNLVSFKYSGPEIPMPLKDVPKLLEVSFLGFYSHYLLPRLSELSRYLSQLEKLALEVSDIETRMEDARCHVFPRLKHLTLTVIFRGFKNLLDYGSLINACPSLHKFSFKFWDMSKCHGRKPVKVEGRPHSIKVVEFIGFRGRVAEVELAMYLIENGPVLEKITFDASTCPVRGSLQEPCEDHISARQRATELGKMLPPSVELIIT